MNAKRKPAHRKRSTRPTAAHRDARYEAPSYDNALAERFFDFRVKLNAVCPETALMYAVLEDAFLCFHERLETERRLMQRARDAEDWFFNDSAHGLFSFLSVCRMLGLDPRYIRQKLKHWTPARLGNSAC